MPEWSIPDFRLAYVQRELGENGLRTDPCGLTSQVVREVAYALWPPVHEDKLSSYGAVITDNWLRHAQRLPEIYSGHTLSCDEKSRLLSDGSASFFVCDLGTPQLWIPGNVAFRSEAALFSLRDDILFKSTGRSPHAPPTDTDFILVQRSDSGTVTVMHWDGITIFRNGRWSFKHYQYKFRVEETLVARGARLSDDMECNLRYLLRLCVHVLSPLHCGATIIHVLDDDVALASRLNRENAIHLVPGINVAKRSQHEMIAHLLHQLDGAALISERGELIEAGVWLIPREDSMREAVSLGGSRQLTACDVSEAVSSPILTVSSDGPVRVFHQGDVIADFSTVV